MFPSVLVIFKFYEFYIKMYNFFVKQSVLKKACSAQLTKPHSSQSIDGDGIYINLSRLGSCKGNKAIL